MAPTPISTKRKAGDPGVALSTKRPRKASKAVNKPKLRKSDDGVWKVKGILDENRTHYQLDWENDPVTGKPFPPDWVEKADVGIAAIEEWNAQQFHKATLKLEKANQTEQNQSPTRPLPPQSSSSGKTTTRRGLTGTPVKRAAGRPRKLIPSSSSAPNSPEIAETQQASIKDSTVDQEQDPVSDSQQVVVQIERLEGASQLSYTSLRGSQIPPTQESGSSKTTNRQDSTLGSSLENSPISNQEPEILIQVEQSSSLEQLTQSELDIGSTEHISSSIPLPGPISSSIPASTSEDHRQPGQSSGVESSSSIRDPDQPESSQSNKRPGLEEVPQSTKSGSLFYSENEDEDEDEEDSGLQLIAELDNTLESLYEVPTERISTPSQPDHDAHSELSTFPRPVESSEPAKNNQEQSQASLSSGETTESAPSLLERPITPLEQIWTSAVTPSPKSPKPQTASSQAPSQGQEAARPPSDSIFRLPPPRTHQVLQNSDLPVLAFPSSSTEGTKTAGIPPPSQQSRLPNSSQDLSAPSSQRPSYSFGPSQPSTPERRILLPGLTLSPSPQNITRPSSRPFPLGISARLASNESPNARIGVSSAVRSPSALSNMSSKPRLRDQLQSLRASSRAKSSASSKDPISSKTTPSPSTNAPETRSLSRNSPERTNPPLGNSSLAAEDQPIPSLENVESLALRVADDMDLDTSKPELPSIVTTQQKLPVDTQMTGSPLKISEQPTLRPEEFVVPLPIDGRIKNQYLAEMLQWREKIGEFWEDPTSELLMDDMDAMLEKLNNTLIHLDFGLNGPATQLGSTQEEAQYSESSSMKFALLGQIIEALNGRPQKIVLLAREGMALQLVTSYLRGKKIPFLQFGGDNSKEETLEMMGRSVDYIVIPINCLDLIPHDSDLVIAFDDIQGQPKYSKWRHLQPILLPWIVYSPEHITRCVPQGLSRSQKLRCVVKAVVDMRQVLGEMSVEIDERRINSLGPGARVAMIKKEFLYKVEVAAEKVVDALMTGALEDSSMLFDIPVLAVSQIEDAPPSTAGMNEASSSRPVSRAGTPGGRKRTRDDGSSIVKSKRPRLTPLADISHVSDSVLKSSQQQMQRIDQLQALLKKTQLELAEERALRTSGEDTIQYKETRLQGLSIDHRRLQHRYETRMKESHTLKNENRTLTASLSAATDRQDRTQNQLNETRDENRTLRASLASARDDLKASPDSAVAGLEAARASARTATAEAAQLRKGLHSAKTDFEFLRTSYQEASSKAGEYVSEIARLEEKVTVLEKKANGEQRRLFEARRETERKSDIDQIDILQAEMAAMKAHLDRTEEEVRLLRKVKGGVVTRGGSAQPQGDTGTASPRPFGAGGVGSRGASPNPTALLGTGAGAGTGTVGPALGGRAAALRNER